MVRIASCGEIFVSAARPAGSPTLSLLHLYQLILIGDVNSLSVREAYGFDLLGVTFSVHLQDGSQLNRLPFYYAPIFRKKDEMRHEDWERLTDRFESLAQLLRNERKIEKALNYREVLIEFPEFLDPALAEKIHSVYKFDASGDFLARSREKLHFHALKFLGRLNAKKMEKCLI